MTELSGEALDTRLLELAEALQVYGWSKQKLGKYCGSGDNFLAPSALKSASDTVKRRALGVLETLNQTPFEAPAKLKDVRRVHDTKASKTEPESQSQIKRYHTPFAPPPIPELEANPRPLNVRLPRGDGVLDELAYAARLATEMELSLNRAVNKALPILEPGIRKVLTEVRRLQDMLRVG